MKQGVAHIPDNNRQCVLDAMAVDIVKMFAPGSSAGGEQPKFLANNDQHEPLVIKFSPPIGTPSGDRWRDLLRMETLASTVLQRCGLEAAKSEFAQTKTRAYLLSKRFDRVGTHGRLHAVSLGAVH
ncbi:MAG: HipA domain-containing protein [Comamonadaceae bacterium]|nr:HipA domain-containing protein [Comamonadaceae bacterium]